MSKKQNYIVKADGWVAGQWRAKGSTVELTEAAAKYENVTLQSEAANAPASKAKRSAAKK